MTETPVSNGRFFLKWLFPFLVHPRQTFEHVLLRKATWYTPLLVVSLLIVAQVAILASRTDSDAVMIPADGMPIEGIPAKGMGTESGSGFAGEGEISPDGMMPGAESSTGWRSTLLPIAGRLAGVDHLHTGTVVGKLEGDRQATLGWIDLLREKYVKEDRSRGIFFDQDWGSMPGAFAVASGGIHANVVGITQFA